MIDLPELKLMIFSLHPSFLILWSGPRAVEELAVFGRDALTTVANHFQEPLRRHNFDIEAAQREWTDLKAYAERRMRGNPRESMSQLWQFVFTEQQERFRNVCLLAEIVLCFPLNTACCEWGFSVMKKIKHDWRASLDPTTLATLLKIALDGPPLADADPMLQRALDHWWFQGQRTRRPNFVEDPE